MSLNGVGGGGAALLRPYDGVRQKIDQERPPVGSPAQPGVARPVPSTGGLLAPRQDSLPVEAPAGTDPELWQVLNSAERAYFAKVTSMGPLTYGRQSVANVSGAGSAAETPLGRGGRIDVKV